MASIVFTFFTLYQNEETTEYTGIVAQVISEETQTVEHIFANFDPTNYTDDERFANQSHVFNGKSVDELREFLSSCEDLYEVIEPENHQWFRQFASQQAQPA